MSSIGKSVDNMILYNNFFYQNPIFDVDLPKQHPIVVKTSQKKSSNIVDTSPSLKKPSLLKKNQK